MFVDRALGVPPLILLIAPIALALVSAGCGPACVALAVAAVAGDYLFIDPAGQFTFHEGIVLTVYLSAGALFMYVAAARRDDRPRSG
jgi:K+-sensing histidine kinase KdpD